MSPEPIRRLPGPLRRPAADLMGLLLPEQCVGCGSWGSWFCVHCHPQVSAPLRRSIPVPGREGRGLLITSTLPYEGAGGEVVRSHKQRGIRSLLPLLAGWLAVSVRESAVTAGPVVLVPVPDSGRARRARGREAWLEVCRETATVLGPGFEIRHLLRWRSRGRAQKQLSRSGRSENVHLRAAPRRGAGADLPPATATRHAPSVAQFILLDDVITTGATLAECARALAGCGISCGHAATVCAAVGP